MKIRLNEKSKINITFVVACLLIFVDVLTTVLGLIAVIAVEIYCKALISGISVGLLYLISLKIRLSEEHMTAIFDISQKSCYWVFKKLEDSKQRFIEFEK